MAQPPTSHEDNPHLRPLRRRCSTASSGLGKFRRDSMTSEAESKEAMAVFFLWEKNGGDFYEPITVVFLVYGMFMDPNIWVYLGLYRFSIGFSIGLYWFIYEYVMVMTSWG